MKSSCRSLSKANLLAFFESEEGQQKFAKWKEDQEKIDLPSVRQKAA